MPIQGPSLKSQHKNALNILFLLFIPYHVHANHLYPVATYPILLLQPKVKNRI